MITDSPTLTQQELLDGTGWMVKPEGFCRGNLCVPMPPGAGEGDLDLEMVAGRLQMPLVSDEQAGVWALGPQSGGRALFSATAPELVLPDADGNPFSLSSLRGRKVLLVAWASW